MQISRPSTPSPAFCVYAIRERMLSGQPFTFTSMSSWVQVELGINESTDHLINKIMDRLRDCGMLAFRRDRGKGIIWQASSAAKANKVPKQAQSKVA